MSCNYADGLSAYENKGVLGAPEKFDNTEEVATKSALLAQWIMKANHVVVHTGAGISTSAGIPDFRGPNGVWTLEKKGLKPNINISFDDAKPTTTHMALKQLVDANYVHFVVSQNIDGLHLKSGIQRVNLAELHGNMFIEQCNACHRQFVRSEATTSVGEKSLNKKCPRIRITGRNCRGMLCDTILDWEANLPENDLLLSEYHSSLADLSICLGTTLQIVPSGNLPLRTKKYDGKVAIVNLQPTKHDKKCDLKINTYVDDVLIQVMKNLNLTLPEYNFDNDPTKNMDLKNNVQLMEWTLFDSDVKTVENVYSKKCKNSSKKVKKC